MLASGESREKLCPGQARILRPLPSLVRFHTYPNLILCMCIKPHENFLGDKKNFKTLN